MSVGWKNIVGGTIGVRLDQKNVVLYWDLYALGKTYKGEKVIFTIPFGAFARSVCLCLSGRRPHRSRICCPTASRPLKARPMLLPSPRAPRLRLCLPESVLSPRVFDQCTKSALTCYEMYAFTVKTLCPATNHPCLEVAQSSRLRRAKPRG
jgi:hypothetical protein